MCVLAAVACGGCARPNAPAMAPRVTREITPVAPGMARVVFVRPATACDTSDHAVVVDESGKFVANLTGGTAFAADVAPGRHAFFLWPGIDMRTDKVDNFRPVSVIELQPASETSSVVRIDVATPVEGRGHCYQQSVFFFEKPAKELDADSLKGSRLVESDQQAGDAYLRERKELSGAYFEMAHGVLVAQRHRRAEANARTERLKKAGMN